MVPALPKPVTAACEVDIQEKKKWIDETNKTIKKLEEDFQQKQNTINCYKENLRRYVSGKIIFQTSSANI